jgi:(E)-4-hydroxy-3-methylbut-2-enyl-diphosphate synthase
MFPYGERRKTIQVKVGKVTIGSDHPITVQSMLKTPLEKYDEALAEACRLIEAGAEILRAAVPNDAAVPFFARLKNEISVPLVADIHFDLHIALKVLSAGADKIRINPGNTRSGPLLREIVGEARKTGAAIRLGVNVGSLPAEFYITYADDLPRAMIETVLSYLRDIEEDGFDQIIISLKSSRVSDMISAYRRLAPLVPYPFHLGVTEAGLGETAIIKSVLGIGTLLAEGIGDTIRVSLSQPGEDEVRVGFSILQALGLRESGFDLIACPTCGRVRVDVEALAARVQSVLKSFSSPERVFRVAVMGCEVNGPGESRMADFGIAGGPVTSTLYYKGEKIARIPNEQLESFIHDFLSSKLNTGEPE